MLDLLKDICGSVSELKTEIGNSGHTSRINLEEMESKLKYPQKFAELSEKSSKLEVECGFYRNQCQTLDEKYMDEKRKNNHLSDLLQEREGDIRQLNLYLKEAESFSKLYIIPVLTNLSPIWEPTALPIEAPTPIASPTVEPKVSPTSVPIAVAPTSTASATVVAAAA